jgi:hypothetical protein
MPRAKPNSGFGHDSWLQVRASHELVGKVEKHVHRRGLSLSEWVRGAVESRLVSEGAALPLSNKPSPRVSA